MEMENIRYGKLRGYEGIFTTNANRLTQHISRILGYQILSTIQVNQYEVMKKHTQLLLLTGIEVHIDNHKVLT